MFENKVSLTRTLLLKLAYKFFSVKLNISDEELKMITVETVKRLGGNGGLCSASYNRDDELVKIEIKLLNMPSDIGLVDALAHEMVHAKQNLNGEFSFGTREIPFLKFFKTYEVIRMHKGQILNDTPYYERVSEQEAFSKSRELTRQFLNFVATLEELPSDFLEKE